MNSCDSPIPKFDLGFYLRHVDTKNLGGFTRYHQITIEACINGDKDAVIPSVQTNDRTSPIIN